jgi:SAM-dependent methyltransferase
MIFRLLRSLSRRRGYELIVIRVPSFSLPTIAGKLKTWNHKSWIRIPMYNLIDDFVRRNLHGPGEVLELGGSEGTLKEICESVGYVVKVAPNYPATDIHLLPYGDACFDGILLDQVLEHLRQPWSAVREVWRVLRNGGFVIATTPLLFRYHAGNGWSDYWRFTPDGLTELFQGFTILVSTGWGNADAIRAMYDRQDIASIRSTPIQVAYERNLFAENDGFNLIMTWIIARKPSPLVSTTAPHI